MNILLNWIQPKSKFKYFSRKKGNWIIFWIECSGKIILNNLLNLIQAKMMKMNTGLTSINDSLAFELNHQLNWITTNLFELNKCLNWILVSHYWIRYWIESTFAEIQTLNWFTLGIAEGYNDLLNNFSWEQKVQQDVKFSAWFCLAEGKKK